MSKPLIPLVMPQQTADAMFRRADLDRLRQVADVVGPFGREQVAELQDALTRATVLLTGWGSPKFDEQLLSASPNLKLIAHTAGSVKSIVTEAVFQRGIRVINAAAVNATPVAEFTVAMMVLMLKQFPWISEQYKQGGIRGGPIRELREMNIGLVSASRVGREVIRLLKSYPMLRIKLYDPFISPEQARQLGVELTSLEEVCRCEVVSIHAPDLPETKHMFNARTLALLPDHAVLINTARGRLIDEDALVAEVRKRPLYVCLDVTHPEPPAADSPLRTEKNILLTPHIAGAMNQARCDMGALAIDEILRFLKKESLQHEVTLQMLPTQA
jgi:phosphoglycerate dehydrogenase-like enzyme